MENNETQGQRSLEWFQKRHKRWTASTNSALMSLGSKVLKKDAGDLYGKLLYKWGTGAKTAIFNMFESRLTETFESESFQSAAMERGEELEPYAVERFLELYLQYEGKDSAEIVSTGFILNPDNDGTKEWEKGYKGENDNAGGSPDHLLYHWRKIAETVPMDLDTGESIPEKSANLMMFELISGLEIKCRNKKETNSHAYKVFDVIHPDWCQVQSQMLSTGCDYWYYVHFDDRIAPPWDLRVVKVDRCQSYIDDMTKRQNDADEIIQYCIDKIVGDISGLLPHEKTARIIEVRKYIDGLDETVIVE